MSVNRVTLKYKDQMEETSYKHRMKETVNGAKGAHTFLIVGWLYLLYVHIESVIVRAYQDDAYNVYRTSIGLTFFLILTLVEFLFYRMKWCERLRCLLISLAVYVNIFAYYLLEDVLAAFGK